jgi:hypothetical protein
MTGSIRCLNPAIAEPFAGAAEAPEAAPSPNPVATSIARAVLHILISCVFLGIGADSEHHERALLPVPKTKRAPAQPGALSCSGAKTATYSAGSSQEELPSRFNS